MREGERAWADTQERSQNCSGSGARAILCVWRGIIVGGSRVDLWGAFQRLIDGKGRKWAS